MESLQDWGFMGGISINSGFYWGSTTGIYYDILGQVGGRLAAGVALCKALGARLPSGGQVCSRLSAPRSNRRVKAWTARRRGVPFVRTKGTPPRRAVLTMPLQKASRRRQARRNYYLLLSIPQSALRLTASRCGSVMARL